MLREKAAALFQIRPEETRLVAWMAALFLLVQAGQGFGDAAAFGLFVSKNADRLPYMYVPLGVIVFLVSLAYTASLGRFQNASVVLNFLFWMIVVLLGEWALIAFSTFDITRIYWLTFNGIGVVLGTLLWTTAGEVCDARQAKRLFPFFTSVGILGSVIGSYLSGVLATALDVDGTLANLLGSHGVHYLILLYALVLVGSFFILQNLTQSYFKPEPPVAVGLNLISDLRSGFDFVRGSGLFRLLAFAAVLFSILFFAVDFPFSQIVSEHYNQDEATVTAFKGNFTGALTLITFIASLVIANRLYARIGIVNSILIMPFTYLIGFVVFYIAFPTSAKFETAVSFRFIQQVILSGVMGTAWSALFNVVPLERRGQVLAFMNGVPSQIGVILSGFLLIVGSQLFKGANQKQILLVGILVTLLCCYIVWKMRNAYGDSLVSALQAGRVEVFNKEEAAFSGYQDDPTALQATFKALNDTKPAARRLAAEMLAKMGSPFAIPDLVIRLTDEDPGVRLAALKALAELDAKPVVDQIALRLLDPEESIREQTLASLAKLEVAPTPELILSLELLLSDPSLKVRARAAVVLLMLNAPARAEPLLVGLLNDADADQRALALDAYRAIAAQTKQFIPFQGTLIVSALKDPVPAVRRNALAVAPYFVDEALIVDMARHLADEDAGVRRAASEALKQVWPQSRSAVLQVLNETDGLEASYALSAIPVGDVEILSPMRNYIQREVGGIQHWRKFLKALPEKGRMTRLVRDTLRHRITLTEERLVKAVGLFGNPQAMELVRRGLKAGDAAARAAALEALETLGDKRITTDVLPILDRGGMFQENEETLDLRQVADYFIAHEDRWLRAMGVYVAIEWEIDDLYTTVRKLSLTDPENLVKEAARIALTYLGGSIRMKTLKTLSTLDRVFLLQDVPMFAGLSPEDLEKIAEVAEEQLFIDQALLCREGEMGNTLFIIASGVVEVLKKVDQIDKVLAARTKGEFVGEMAILEAAPRSATLKARGGVRALVIDGQEFHAILYDRPQVAVSVLRHMSARVRELNDRFGAS